MNLRKSSRIDDSYIPEPEERMAWLRKELASLKDADPDGRREKLQEQLDLLEEAQAAGTAICT